jgi:hypothetical protein
MSDSVRHTGSQCDAGRIPASTCPAPAGDVGDWTDFGETGDTGDTGETGDAGRGVVAASAAFPLSAILEAEIDSHGEILCRRRGRERRLCLSQGSRLLGEVKQLLGRVGKHAVPGKMWDGGGSWSFFFYSIPSPPRALPQGRRIGKGSGFGWPRFCSRKRPSSPSWAVGRRRRPMGTPWNSPGSYHSWTSAWEKRGVQWNFQRPVGEHPVSLPRLFNRSGPCLHPSAPRGSSQGKREVLTARAPVYGRGSRCEPLTASGCSCGPMQPSRSCRMTPAAFGCHLDPTATAACVSRACLNPHIPRFAYHPPPRDLACVQKTLEGSGSMAEGGTRLGDSCVLELGTDTRETKRHTHS